MAETALITGASSGIGVEFARQLAGRGYDLVLVARREQRMRELAEVVAATAHVVPCDLGSEAAALPERVREAGVDVDLLVNNAGFGAHGRTDELAEGRAAEMVRVNCEAVVLLTRAFLPAMVERGRGGVINMGSMSGDQPLPYAATYSASKAFVQYFTEALHEELRGTGVRALVVNPGPVPTEWSEVAGYNGQILGVPPAVSAPQVVEEALAAYEKGRRAVTPGRAARMSRLPAKTTPRSLQLRVTGWAYGRK